jgi:hypothetical protein
MRLFVFIVLAILAPSTARAELIPDAMLTDSMSSILCTSPFKLNEAMKAASVADDAWLRSLGCMSAKGDLPVMLISSNMTDWLQPWQVRVKLPDGSGITLWGNWFSFKRANGKPLR